jgi:hypothetical protein
MALACSATVMAFSGCVTGGSCVGSETIVWIPKDRAPSVTLATARGSCGARPPWPYDGGVAYYYFIGKMDGAAKCEALVQFNDGSPEYRTDVPMDSDGCLLPQPIYVPEK